MLLIFLDYVFNLRQSFPKKALLPLCQDFYYTCGYKPKTSFVVLFVRDTNLSNLKKVRTQKSAKFNPFAMDFFFAQDPYNFTPITFTFTVSTIIPVKPSTLYLIASLRDSATALIETPYFITTYTST